jgi:plastocyanin
MKAFLAPVAIAAALFAAPVAQADTVHVGIKNFMFTPMTVTITQGTTVQWINLDDIPHTVVEKTKAWRSPALDTNDTYTKTFDQPGTYEYFCGLHPQMVAKVIVTPAAGKPAKK